MSDNRSAASTSLNDFLRQKEQAAATPPVAWTKCRKEWLRELTKLYDTIPGEKRWVFAQRRAVGSQGMTPFHEDTFGKPFRRILEG